MQYLSGVPQYSSHLKWWIPGGWNDIWHQIPFRHPPLPVRFISGLARVPVIDPMGEPNTPTAFRRRDVYHLKQQAGRITYPRKTEKHPANMECHYILNRYFIS